MAWDAAQQPQRQSLSPLLSSDMDPQTALPRALLLLLFLHLSPLGGRSHPLGSPSPALELSAMQVSTAACVKAAVGSSSSPGLSYCPKRSQYLLGISDKGIRK